MTAGKATAPLRGTLVVEFGTGYVAPLAAMYLGFLGASVIKIENRDNPDFMRGDLRSGSGLSPSFIDANRGKKSVAINVKTPAGRDLVQDLVKQADVLVENLGAGVVARLGFSYAAVSALNDRIVMASMQGLGADVVNSTTLGQNLPPLIGLTHLWNHPGADKPVGSQLFHPDYFAGVYSAALIIAALADARRTGRGHFIDCAQAEVAAALLGPQYLACQVNGGPLVPMGNVDPASAPSGCYPCKGEDVWVYINVRDDRQWQRMAAILSESGEAVEERHASLLARLRDRARLDERMRTWTCRNDADVIVGKLQTAGIACGVVQNVQDLVSDDRHGFNEFVHFIDHAGFPGIAAPGTPVRIAGIELNDRQACPRFAESTRQVLHEQLGLADAHIDALIAERVIEESGERQG